MTGICDNGHIVHWRNTKGSRKPESCYESGCGAAIHNARYVGDGKYERAASPGRKGVRLLPCAVCGRKRRVPSGYAHVLNEATRFRIWQGFEREATEIVVEAGNPVCWYHETIPAGQQVNWPRLGSAPVNTEVG